MAQQRNQSDSKKFSCSICLDLLKDPVSTSCGHNYCMDCIKTHWDGEDEKNIYSCPQCRKIFRRRPELEKNTMLAELVEDLKKAGLQAAAADDQSYAGPEDVSCDVCPGRKRKAVKSCGDCLAPHFENHLQLHDDSPPLKKPSKNLQENICSRHDEVMKIFCVTDQQLICYLCRMNEHKGHETVSAAAERKKKQKELEVSRQNIQQRIQDKEKDVKLLQQEPEDINVSADKIVEDSEKMFTQMIHLIQKRGQDVKQQIRSQQETEKNRVKELQEKLKQEIIDLKRKDDELKQLSETPDHIQFLHNYPSVSDLSESTHSSSINIRPLRHFEDVTAAVKELRDLLQDILRDTWTNTSLAITGRDVLLSDPQSELEPGPEPEPEPEPKTRVEFLKYSTDITLDPNTAHSQLMLYLDNRKAIIKTAYSLYESHPDHPDRFTDYLQVLSEESLTGRCYWEVEGFGKVGVAVAYENICRKGKSNECVFGRNDKSWSLRYDMGSYIFWHNNTGTPIPGDQASRIGVYLDHRAGILSFYSVSETMNLIHRVQTTFTEPLHAGARLMEVPDSAEFYSVM